MARSGTQAKRATRDRLVTEQNNRCHWCGVTMTEAHPKWSARPPTAATLDHIYPRNDPRRLTEIGKHVAACLKCNSERGADNSEFIPL